MICFVHRDPKFEKSLSILREKGGNAFFAAKKAEEIIYKLITKGRENAHKVGRLTKKGELRIKYGIKYDLGHGYRLICAKRGSHLILLYIGSHDDCSRWLENNKGLECAIEDTGKNKTVTQQIPFMDCTSAVTVDPADEYEDHIMKSVNDKVLRNIFCGLVEK